MEDSASLRGRSSSTDVLSNDSAVIPPESESSPRDGGDIADIGKHEQVDGSEHELSGLNAQENTERSFSELSVGTTSQDDTGTTPQNETEATEDDTEAAPQNKSGAIPGGKTEATQDETETTRDETETTQNETERTQNETETTRDETETTQNETETRQDETETTRDETETTQNETETTRDETETTQNETETRQDETETTPQDKSGAIPGGETEATQDETETNKDETEAAQDDIEASSQYKTGTTPQDEIAESNDNIGIKPLSPDPSTKDRQTSQQSVTGADRNKQCEQQGELTDDVVSGTQSPIERLSTFRQCRCEDATCENGIKELDVGSEDEASLNTTDSQHHTSIGSPSGCCCVQQRDQVKDELEAESRNVEIVATPVVLDTVVSRISLEPHTGSRLSSQDEPNLAAGDLCKVQLKYEELGEKESHVLGQCCQKVAVEDFLRVRSPEAENQLKAEIISLQSRLETLTKDNNEKGMRIVALETNLLEMTAKLLNAEKTPLPLEVSPSRRETNKSRTCAIL